LLPTRFIWRLYAGYILLILLATVTAVIFVSRQVEGDSLASIETTLRSEACMLRDSALPALGGEGGGDFQSRIEALGRETGTRFTVIDADGGVLADSEKDPALMDNHASRPEIIDAREKGLGRVTRFSRTLGVRMLYLALPVERDGEPQGFVRTALPLDSVQRRLGRTRRMILLGAALASVLALLIGILLARRSTAPLRSMTRAALETAAGKRRGRVPENRGSVEMRELAASFNSMSDQLEDRLAAIEGERNKLAAILAGMNEGVLAVDAEECVLHLNRLAAELLRIDPDRDAGRPVWECSRIPDASDLLSRALRERRFLRRETTLVADGGQRIIEMKASPLPGSGERPPGAVLVLDEVTELRQLGAVRRDFIANASHELKTPLTVIRGLTETLHEDPEMEAATRIRFLEKLDRQVGRLVDLVGDLLSISRLESEMAPFDMEKLDLAALAVECAAEQESVAEAAGLRLETEPSERALPVRGDRASLGQAIGNLLDNALKYTPRGGRVVLRARASEGWAVVEVEDDGIGIEPDQQARVFERFYRVDRARSRELGGTGLGLSIVKHTALAHGGEISVESQAGLGSRFRLRLPLDA